jgi:hypothetical protein
LKIPQTADADVRLAFKDVWDVLDDLTRRDIDLNGRKIINAGTPIASADYMRKTDIESGYSFDIFYNKMKIAGVNNFPGILKDVQPSKVILCLSTTRPKATDVGKLFYETDTGVFGFCTGSGYVTIVTESITGLYSARPAATTLANGVTYYSTDQNTLYIVNTNAWKWLAGYMSGATGSRPTLAAGDVGFRYLDTTLTAEVYWNGSIWVNTEPDASTTIRGVITTGAQSIAGVKTFTSDPIVPDEAYGAGWDGVLEPPTKNAVYDKIQTLVGYPDIIYGLCLGDEIGWSQASAVQNTWYAVTDADINDGALNGVSHDGSGTLSPAATGVFLIMYSLSIECNTSGKHVTTGISVNAATPSGINHQETQGANSQTPISGFTIGTVSVGETVTVVIGTTDTGTPNIAVDHLMLAMIKVRN